MRISWFTPFNPRSSIGHYSQVIAEYLARRDDVVVYAAEPADVLPRAARVPVVRVPAQPDAGFLDELGRSDFLVYNMGDHYLYHHAIYDLAVRRPGILILHDLVLRDFFYNYYLGAVNRPDMFPRLLDYSHGAAAAAQIEALWEGRHVEWVEDPTRLSLPMFRPALHRALGVVVHSDFAAGRVRPVCPAPLVKLDFPIHGPTESYVVSALPRTSGCSGRIQLLTFGVLNPNKLVHATLRAIAASPLLRQSVCFTVVGEGPPAYTRDLQTLIAAERLEEVVTLAGHRSDEELREQLLRADIVVNLRNPHLGESSGSLLNALVAGVATVVWDHGFYGEFPDDVVCKIAAEEELRPTLERLVRDAEERERLGSRARSHALTRFDTEQFCVGFRTFLETVRSYRPVLELVDRVSDVLLELGSGPVDGLGARMAETMALFIRADEAEEELTTETQRTQRRQEGTRRARAG
jgi:glycosyltransferase involved in cell wall biosynthesis